MPCFLPNTTIELYGYFRECSGSPLIDTDAIPTFEILDSTNFSLYTGTTEKVSEGIYKATWQAPLGLDTSLTYRIEWSASIHGNVVQGAVEAFTFKQDSPVFESINTSIQEESDIKILDRDLIQVKKVMAYPCAENILLSDSQIKEIVIYPTMMEYFTKFPIAEYQQVSINGEIKVDYPDETVFGIVSCRVNGKYGITSSGGAPGSDMWSIIKSQGHSGSSKRMYRGNYGDRYNPENVWAAKRNYRYVADTLKNDNTFNYYVDKSKRQLIAYSSINAMIEITWAKWSNNFNDIPYEFKKDALDLAQAALLQHFVDSLQISTDNSAEVTLGISEMQTRADTLRESVTEKWNSFHSHSMAIRF